jgi:hypothetical protein
MDRLFREFVGQLKAEASVEAQVFRDIDAMVGGEDWRERLQRSLADALVFIPVVSSRYFASGVCMEEFNTFRAKTVPDEVPSAIIPLVLAGHRLLRPDAEQEEMRFIESLNWRDLQRPYRAGYESALWRDLVHEVVHDVLKWHEEFGARRETITVTSHRETGHRMKLDDTFIAEVGLTSLAPEEKQGFLKHIYWELQLRVGELLTRNQSSQQLDEFGLFVDTDEPGMSAWFAEHMPDYEQSEEFHAVRRADPAATKAQLMAEYGARMWLALNQPDHLQVVSDVLEELKSEIRADRDSILGDPARFREPHSAERAMQMIADRKLSE